MSVTTKNTIETETLEGPVRGLVEDGLAVFRGVPFAQAPTGVLRFRPPAPPPPRAGVLDAISPAPMCPQPPLRIAAAMGEFLGDQDEDCLTSTIWAPLPLDRTRPILFWLHGGALSSGGGSHPWYDGGRLARENDIVIVAPNYRLGALGFLCRSGLADGNMGFLDQIRALEWVQENAASFGGDRLGITLLGQSAGAGSIALMLALPDVRRRFRRAIFLSGGFVSAPLPPRAVAEAVGDRFCAALGIDPADPDARRELEAASVERILEAQVEVVRGSVGPTGSIMPTFVYAAGGELPEGPALSAAIRRGAAGIDALVGETTEEMRVFQGLDPRLVGLEAEDLPKVAENLFGPSWPSLIERARHARPGATPEQAVTDAYTASFVRGVRQLGEAVARGDGRAWFQRFAWSAPASGFGACHCLDLPFVFGSFSAFEGAPMLAGGEEAQMEALGGVIRAAIGRFVRTGSPEGADLPNWPAFSRSRPVQMVFDSILGLGWLDLEEPEL